MRITRAASRSRAACGAVGLVLVFGLAACGESKEEKAEKSICSARSDINSKVNQLQSLTPSTAAITEAKDAVTAIANDLTKIVESSKELSPEAKANVQREVTAFKQQLAEGIANIAKGGSSTSVAEQLKASLNAIATAYKQDLAQIKC
jgi:hypothetical protein